MKKKIFSINLSEIFFKAGDILSKKNKHIRERMYVLGYFLYEKKANKFIINSKADIYHYRNCYGGQTVINAQKRSIKTICDHSIAHPAAIEWMINNKGKIPPSEIISELKSSLVSHYKKMLLDLGNNDLIIVNSDFVKESLIHFGIDANRIYVVYLGVDDQFLIHLNNHIKRNLVLNNKILFAGGWQYRKGVLDLVEALSDAEFDWTLDIAGGSEYGLNNRPTVKAFIDSSNVNYLGILPREKLAELMCTHQIFVFPSYCEGSARVIFEAMAAGLYIITTKNSGSIVQNGINGEIIEPGNPTALKNAIQYALNNIEVVREIGLRNRKLILEKYTQKNYGDNILKVYKISDSN